MKKNLMFIVVFTLCARAGAEDLRSTSSGSAYDAARWVGQGRANITATAASAVITGSMLDSLRVGDAIVVPADVLLGIVAAIAGDGMSLTLEAASAVSYGPGPFTFYRQPLMTDDITVEAGHVVDASTGDGIAGLTVQDLTINGTFVSNLIDMNIGADFTLNAGGTFTLNRPGRVIMDGENAFIGGTAAVIPIRSLRVKTTNVTAHTTLLRPVVAAETLDVENAHLNLNGHTLTIGTGTGGASGASLVKGTFRYINGPGTLTRWINAATVTYPNNATLFQLCDNGANRNAWFGGTFTTGGTISVAYAAGSGTSAIAFTDPDTALTVDKRTNFNWTVATSGVVGTGLTLAVQASGLGGVASLTDLTLSAGAANANGTFSTTGGTLADPRLYRQFVDEAMLPGTYYIASAPGSAMPVELTSFTASARNTGVVLHWTTAAELNNYGFEIERRAYARGAGVWMTIGFTDGSGTTNMPHSYSFTDNTVSGPVEYRLKQIDRDGRFHYSAAIETAAPAAPGGYALMQNYPNPFNPSTKIHFTLPATQHATLSVYNTLGQMVTILFDGIAEGNTMHSVAFDAVGLSSGIYFYALRSGEKSDVRKMQLLR